MNYKRLVDSAYISEKGLFFCVAEV